MSVYLLIVIATLCTLGGQLILKPAVTNLKSLLQAGPLEFLIGAATSPQVLAALALQVLGYVVWLFVLSREKLSVAFAVSGASFYILMAAASWLFYGERLSSLQWLGLVLISVGVVLVTAAYRTPGLS